MGDVRIKSYRDLIVWQQAMESVVEMYRIAALLPSDERFGLRAQMTRAAVSVALNIAEGHGRGGSKEFDRFLDISRGSAAECETLLEIGVRIGLFRAADTTRAHELLAEVGKMSAAIQRRIRQRRDGT